MHEEKANTQENLAEDKERANKARVKKERNKLLPAVIILAVLTVAGCGFGIWGVVNGLAQGREIDNLKTEVADKNEEIADLKGVEVEEVVNENNEQVVIEDRRSVNLPMTKGKQILPAGEKASDWWLVEDHSMEGWMGLGLRQSANGDEASAIEIEYNPAKMGQFFGLNLAGGEEIQTLKVGKIDADKVVDVKIALFGQGVCGRESLLYLMEDGTIEYTNIEEALKSGRANSEGAIPGVENVVRFYTIELGGSSVFAQRADGDFYDLDDYLPE